MRVGALAWPVEPTAGPAGLAAKLDRWIGAAAGAADLLLMPEYACMELAQRGEEAAELAAMVEMADAVLAEMRAAAIRHGVWLCPGSLPMRRGGRIVNRAPLIRPDGAIAFQDKWQMTRFERERWGVERGAGPSVFDTPWGRIGISICYDAEFPKHVRAQVEAGAWLILVPACTDTPAGATRVRLCARARAIENQCILAVAPTVGDAPFSATLDVNHGRAGIYGPADRGFPDDGVIAEGPPDQPGWVFATLDPAAIARVREEGAVRNHRDWPRGPLPPVRPAAFA
ncbi:MAG: carbon-nitrogen hydrolase family protein [Rhodovarius sp.]|nr:carbon-nitrogen hydrolase family protein [Rhodovarius sp.]